MKDRTVIEIIDDNYKWFMENIKPEYHEVIEGFYNILQLEIRGMDLPNWRNNNSEEEIKEWKRCHDVVVPTLQIALVDKLVELRELENIFMGETETCGNCTHEHVLTTIFPCNGCLRNVAYQDWWQLKTIDVEETE